MGLLFASVSDLNSSNLRYDVVVIGGGHAGAEAAFVAAGMGASVALVTMDPSKIGAMSCNPAIGGLAKGQIVREIDAIGGLMGRAIDATGIQFRMLNTSKGAAVHGPRAQADKYAYATEVQRLLATRSVAVIAATVDELIVEGCRCRGVWANRQRVEAAAVVLTTGTFMRGLMHTGEAKTAGGRVGEGAAVGIGGELRRLGFELGRLKTGTPPRLAAESIDFSALEPQSGDAEPRAFSEMSPAHLPGGGERFPVLPQIQCHTTHTSEAVHALIRENLHRAPMYSGQIEAECGPRYCPSIEDKVVRFADRSSHHIFLEPESLTTNEVYCNGISTSLPREVQDRLVPLIRGLEKAVILRHGYAVEYDMVWPHQIDATGMTKRVEGLFLAGQINGTSGYEEAAGQGLVAGINAVRYARGEGPVRLGRETSYLGVMMDDLVTKTPREPYRMFTSRAEYRLLLRADNAPDRLTPLGKGWGTVCADRWRLFERRQVELARIRSAIDEARVEGRPLREIARSTQTSAADARRHLPASLDARLVELVVNDLQYEGYVAKQLAEVKRLSELEAKTIPPTFPFEQVSGLGAEAIEVLRRFRPTTLGQAGRLAGINPVDVTLLSIAIKGWHDRAGRPSHTAA